MTEDNITDGIEDVNKALDGSKEFDDAPEWAQALVDSVEANARLLDGIEERREAALEAIGKELDAQAKRNQERIEALTRETGVETIEAGDGHPSKNGHTPGFEKYDSGWATTLGLGR